MKELVTTKSRIEQALMVPEVANRLTPLENMLCSLKSGVKVKDLKPDVFIKSIGYTTKRIASSVGLKNIESSDIANFERFIRIYYNNLTIEEINTAFDLALVGELDEFLPKGKDNQPDRNHYQSFSMEYVTKIINAYKKKLSKTVVKAYKLLPPPEKVITEEEKQNNIDFMKKDIIIKFSNYKTKNILPHFIVNHAVMLYLLDIGVVDSIPEPRESALDIAFSNIVKGVEKVDNYSKSRIIKDKENDVVNDELKARAYKHEVTIIVKEWFDKLIKDNVDIDKFLNDL